MAIDARTAADHIMTEVHATAPQHGGIDALAGTHFCSLWPQVRPVLQMLVGIVGFIPGAGQTGAAVLKGLVKIGDEVSAELCQ